MTKRPPDQSPETRPDLLDDDEEHQGSIFLYYNDEAHHPLYLGSQWIPLGSPWDPIDETT